MMLSEEMSGKHSVRKHLRRIILLAIGEPEQELGTIFKYKGMIQPPEIQQNI